MDFQERQEKKISTKIELPAHEKDSPTISLSSSRFNVTFFNASPEFMHGLNALMLSHGQDVEMTAIDFDN